MGLSSLFGCEEWAHACVNDMFGVWGANELLSDERLQAKLVSVITLTLSLSLTHTQSNTYAKTDTHIINISIPLLPFSFPS